jgi:outer membrane immunogenic protein
MRRSRSRGQQRRDFAVAPSRARERALRSIRAALLLRAAPDPGRGAPPFWLDLWQIRHPRGRVNGLGSPRPGGGHAVKKRLALAFVALGLTPAASPAAELSVAPLYRPVPFVPRQTVEWTGLYLGVNAGYGWGRTSTSTSFQGDPNAGILFADFTPTGDRIPGVFTTPFGAGATELSRTSLGGSGKLSGAIAGGQIGFNWQAGWAVFGAEFDAQWSGQTGSLASTCSKVGCFATEGAKLKSLLTGRARFGVAFDWILPYVTAGAALANASDDLAMTVGGISGAFTTHSDSRLGWTAGAGVDVALTSNWSARLEYLYVDIRGFGDFQRIPIALGVGSTIQGMDVRDNIVRVGVNYRFGPRGGPGVIERPVLAPAGYASAYNFLPSLTSYRDSPIFGEKRAPSATMLAAPAPQREAPIVTARGTERAPAAVIAGEVPQREAPIAAAGGAERPGVTANEPKVATANAPKGATPTISRFADIEESDDSVRLTTTGAAITLPTVNKRQNAGDDNRRLKSIMSICSGC